MCEIIVLMVIAVVFLLYTFGMFHAIILDGWRPWKHGIKWWKMY
jgi:hypothetical protein